jgi:hypothetical protein
MYDKNPYCPICGVLMILPEDLAVNQYGKIKYFPDNTCTYEHLFTRADARRKSNRRNMILCRRCNNKLNDIEMSQMPIEELWERSGRKPQNILSA